jgi:DNA-binding GntR family transcriptional regulator
VAASLRRRVVSGEFKPGDQLREFQLAAEYAVARPTIRAALQQLALTGLVRRTANRSAVVPGLTAGEVVDLFQVRALIELEVVRRVHHSGSTPQAAAEALRRLESFSPATDWADVVEADLAFHRALAQSSGSKRLLRLFELLEDEIRLAIAQLRPAYGAPAELAQEHRELLSAIESSDGDNPVALMERHLDRAMADLIAD